MVTAIESNIVNTKLILITTLLLSESVEYIVSEGLVNICAFEG